MPYLPRSLPLLAISLALILYTFDFIALPGAITMGLISVAALYFGLRQVLQQTRELHDELATSERHYGYGGNNFRTFTDSEGELWFRLGDLRRAVVFAHSDAHLTKCYPNTVRKAHPGIDALFIHTEALFDLLGKNLRPDVQRFLAWVRREVLRLHERDRQCTETAIAEGNSLSAQLVSNTDRASPPLPIRYLLRHWQGELGLFTSLFVSAFLVFITVKLLGAINMPLDFVAHYRKYALLYMAQVIALGGGLYWWGHGVVLSVQRWINADRSLLLALLAFVAGISSIFYALSHLIDTDKKYLLTDFITIMLDADAKPALAYDRERQQIQLSGDLGFGSTLRLRRMLAEHPEARGIELKSYGGRLAEGWGLAQEIKNRGLNTYVRAECMSACVVAYTAGTQRYVAESAQFGLHRSGTHWQSKDTGMSPADTQMANYFIAAGVDPQLVERGMQHSIRTMYKPTPQEVLDANLATDVWGEPKPPSPSS